MSDPKPKSNCEPVPGVWMDFKADAMKKIIAHFGNGCVEQQMLRVADVREQIAVSAGLAMPMVCLDSFGWAVPGGVILGCAGPGSIPGIHEAGVHEWMVQLPISVPLLMEGDDDLRRLLIHEFSHVFREVLDLLRPASCGPAAPTENLLAWPIAKQAAYLCQRDSERLVDPAGFFSEADCRGFMVHTDGDPANTRYAKSFTQAWAKQNLPTRLPPMFYSITDGIVACDRSIAARAKKILGSNPSADLPLLEVSR